MGTDPSELRARLSPELEPHLNQIVAEDSAVRVGQLSNGLRYYIRSHDNPENRALFRFVMHVGSLEEDDDQQGLAHILEHMAFNGSTHFEPQALDAYFQSIGMRFGAHVNASTSFEQTIYKLETPTDDPKTLQKTFQVLRDWGDGLLLLSQQIEKERLVGLEEWRSRRSGQMRTLEQMLPTMYWKGRQVDRMPIGTEESLKGFSQDALKRFYQDWYRPDLCTLIVVGDISVDEIEGYVQSYLNGWSSESVRNQHRVPLPIHKECLFGVVQDATMPFPMLVLSQKHPLRLYETEGEWFWKICKYELMVSIINERLRFLHRAMDSQVQHAKLSMRYLGSNCEQEVFQVVLDADNWEESFREIMAQCKQLQEYGVTANELDRAKQRRLSMVNVLADNIPTMPSEVHLQNILSHVLEKEPLWPEEGMKEITERWLPMVEVDDINLDLKSWLKGDGLVVHFLTPTEGYTDSDLEQWIKEAGIATVEPYIEETTDRELMPDTGTVGEIISESVNPEMGVHEWVFSNGVKVWLKNTEFEENLIRWNGWSPGGYSLIEDEDLHSATCLNSMMALSNVGPHTTDDINRLMNAVPGTFRYLFSQNAQQLSGQSTREGLLPTLKLLWLRSQQSTFSEQMLQKIQKMLFTRLSNENSDPDTQYFRRRNSALYGDHFRKQMLKNEDIGHLSLESVQRAYQILAQPISDMHFSFVGLFDWDEMRTVLSKTLGTLPPIKSREYQERNIHLVLEEQTHTFTLQDEPKAEIDLTFVQKREWTDLEQRTVQVAVRILNERLRKSLREEEAGTYTVSAYWMTHKYNSNTKFVINFGCNPSRVDELRLKALAVVEQFINYGISETEFAIEMNKQRRALEKSWKKNDFWLAVLKKSISKRRALNEIPDQEVSLSEITLSNLNDGLPLFFSMEYFCHTTSIPKKSLE